LDCPRFGAHMNSIVPMRRASLRRGFSILELITVIVVVGVLATISAGKVQEVMTQQRLYRASNIVQTNVEAAWALAARNRRPIRITWDSANRQMRVTDRGATTNFRRVSLGQDPYGLRPGSVRFSKPTLEVFPDGLADDTLLITLSSTGLTKKVWVSRAGLVQQVQTP
jgi:prepilin-type N-terminal cleavage/methylation domain-containing protein